MKGDAVATAALNNLTGLGKLNLGGLSGLAKSISPPAQLKADPSPSTGKSQPPLKSIASRQEAYADIETIPDESRRHLFGLDKPVEEAEQTTPPYQLMDLLEKGVEEIREIVGQYNPPEMWLIGFEAWEKQNKKPRKGVLDIVRSIRCSRMPDPDSEAKKIKTMSVTPEYLQIVAIGIAHGDGEIQGFISDDHIGGTVTEADLLDWFWATVKDSVSLVGFNILGFDLPAIMVRSAILGVKPSRIFDSKPWGNDVIDLMLKRWPKGNQFGMKHAAKLYGIEPPAGDMDGSQTFKMWQEDPLKVREYVMSDVFVTRELKKKWKGLFC